MCAENLCCFLQFGCLFLHPLFRLCWVSPGVFLALPCSSLRRAFRSLRYPFGLAPQVGQWGHSASPLPLWVIGVLGAPPVLPDLCTESKAQCNLTFFVEVFLRAVLPWPKAGLYNLIFPVCEQMNCIVLDVPLWLLHN